MTMTDPVADMLTRLRNANSAFHESVSLPSSKLKTHIAEILKREGYISSSSRPGASCGPPDALKSPHTTGGTLQRPAPVSAACRACR